MPDMLRPRACRVTVGLPSEAAAGCACFSLSSRRPSVTCLVTSLPLRTTATSTALPTGVDATMRGRSRESFTSLPSNLTITSPTSRPAGLAGPLSSMPAMSAPRAVPRFEALGSRIVHVLDAHAEPAAAGLAELAKLVDDRHAVEAGTAKPMPTEPPVGERMAVLMPITSPFMLNSGPPELPLLMEASVWM